MPEHWRLGVVERSVLEAMDQLGLRPDRLHRKCANIVHRAAEEFGVSTRYGYEALCAMSQPWLLHLLLVDFHGNNGGVDFAAAPPEMTEARLSSVGVLALDGERGSGPRVPVMLINGDLHVDGWAPPLSPSRVMAALRALQDAPDLSDDDLIERVGPPESPTGCNVVCDHLALGRGEPTEMICAAQMSHEHLEDRRLIVLSCLPPGVGDDTLIETIAGRVEAMNPGDPFWEPWHVGDWQVRHGSPDAATAIPLADIRNESTGAGWGNQTRIVCELLPEADLAECQQAIATIWGVRTERQVQLAAPLPQLMRELVDDDQEAQRAALTILERCLNARPAASPASPGLVITQGVRSMVFVWPDADTDHRYPTPEEAALAEPRRLDETPRLIAVELPDETHAEVEVDLGRHPADRAVYQCVREKYGRWHVQGSRKWFDDTPVNVEAATPSENLGLYIVESPIGGYELMITGYDFKSTHASHHATIEQAKKRAAEKTGLSDLDWQPKTSFEEDS